MLLGFCACIEVWWLHSVSELKAELLHVLLLSQPLRLPCTRFHWQKHGFYVAAHKSRWSTAASVQFVILSLVFILLNDEAQVLRTNSCHLWAKITGFLNDLWCGGVSGLQSGTFIGKNAFTHYLQHVWLSVWPTACSRLLLTLQYLIQRYKSPRLSL